jgi:ATP-dependent RNA helicase HelY
VAAPQAAGQGSRGDRDDVIPKESSPRPNLGYDFELDPFQVDAIDALTRGRSVLVAAPTGSGKTVVAEHAIAEAMVAGERTFYTTPIKALSNQKYRDLVRRHGADAVGLLTGDNAVNGDAPIVVMTTEVLRNMIYAGSPALHRLRYVVLDEVHYLQDAYRGPVWEEVIVHLPQAVRLVCLSATVSNAAELASWIEAVRGPTSVVVEQRRPVELVNLFMVADRTSDRLHLVPTLVDGRANPEGQRFDGEVRPMRRERGRPRRPFSTPHRLDVVDRLAADGLLPAIVFIFSRAACDDAVRSCLHGHVRLTTADERERIRAVVEERTQRLSDDDLDVLRYDEWLEGLLAGVAAHHAGMVPPFKETVEVLFTEGLVKLAFATETLALGINMPARTVVIEKLTKFTGDHHEFLTPADYTQLTGRAGRRGIDPRGHAVVLWSPFTTFQQVADLASSRSFTLRSAFRPTYNMAANLIRRYRRDEAHHLLNRSFAQYQHDRALVVLEQRLERRRSDIERLADSLGGQRESVADERRRVDDAAMPRAAFADALARLRPGDVILTPERGEPAAVVSVAHRRGGAVRVRLVTAADVVTSIGESDLRDAPDVVGTIEMPVPFAPGNRAFQHDVAERVRRMRRAGSPAARRRGAARTRTPRPDAELRRRLRTLEALERAEREVADLERRIDGRTDSIARRFDDVLGLLEAWGHVEGWSLTVKGQQLVRIFHECDLLVAEALAEGLFDGLDTASVAGLASIFVYEHRSPAPPPPPWFPNATVRQRVERIGVIAEQLNRDEQQARLPPTRRPDPTFFALAHAWAAGESLEHVLADEDLSAGDFVRTVKQLVDLLRQLADAASAPATVASARAAADAIQRGVVAVSGAIDADADADAVPAEAVPAEAVPAEAAPPEARER